MNKVDKFKMVIALALASIVVYNLVMFISQETCSDYSCPDGYVNNDNKKDEKCDSLECSEVDIPKCCNKSVNCEGSWSDFSECSVECGGGTQTKTYTVTTQPQYGGTPCPTSPESQACNTQACENIQSGNDASGGNEGDDIGVVENATCSTVSVNCPVGYLYKIDSAGMECNGPTCDVGTGGVDLDTCCEQGCSAPNSMPTGYTGNLPATQPVGGGDITGVQCGENYNGTPTYTCTTAGTEYTLDGCDPDVCTTPPDQTGYNINSIRSLESLERNNFPVNVTCEDGYGPSTQGVIPQASCSGDSVDYSLTGCENKTGFCSGNTDSSNDVLCPTTGYNDKPDKNTIVGNTLETCCDQIITPEAQPSGTQDTELPICSQVAVPNKIAEILYVVQADNLQDCSDLCTSLPTCQSFAYSDIDPTRGRFEEDLLNCIISGSSGTIDPYDRFINEDYLSWSFYPKCRVSQSGGQTPEVQESPQLPFCSDIKIPNKMALGNLTENLRTGDVGTCIDTCFTQRDNCNSFSYGRVSGRCYFYGEENITAQQQNDDYDYYPVKCQP